MRVIDSEEPLDKTITYQQIKQAFADLAEADKLPSWQMAEIRNNDLAFDAYIGDITIQQALFDKIVYA